MRKSELEYIFYRMQLSRRGKKAEIVETEINMGRPGTYHTEINYISPTNITWTSFYHSANQRCPECRPSRFNNSRSPRPEHDQALSKKLNKLKYHHSLPKNKGFVITTTIKTNARNIHGNSTIRRLELEQRLDYFNKKDH